MPDRHQALADSTLVTQEIVPQVASSAQTGTGVNMSGWDNVDFHISLGTFTGSAVCDARVVGSANANFSGAVNITNAALTQIASASANNAFVISVRRPTNTYLRCVVTPAVNNVALSVTAIRYGRGGVLPPTQAAGQVVKIVEN